MPPKKKKENCSQAKVHKVMSEYKAGGLHSGPGKKNMAGSRKQAVAIALSEARRKCGGSKPRKQIKK